MTEEKESKSTKHIYRIIFWVISVAVIGVLIYMSYVGITRQSVVIHQDYPPKDVPPNVIIYVDPNNNGEYLSLSNLEQINSVVKKWEEISEKRWIAIISPNKVKGLYAKIILHSHGMYNHDIRIIQDIDDITWDSESVVYAAPQLPSDILKDLREGKKITVNLSSRVPLDSLPVSSKADNLAIILGNEPLDESTPTIDLVKRTLKGVEYFKNNLNTFMLLTGGPTAGEITEAKMMALIAYSRGVPLKSMLLEEKAETTEENAVLSAKLVAESGLQPVKTVIISKESHLKAAIGFFHSQPIFKDAEKLPSGITEDEIIKHMEIYLEEIDNGRVQTRLKALKQNIHGVD